MSAVHADCLRTLAVVSAPKFAEFLAAADLKVPDFESSRPWEQIRSAQRLRPIAQLALGEELYCWDPVTLARAQDLPPARCPEDLAKALQDEGFEALFGRIKELSRYNTQQYRAAYRTDLETWRQPLANEGGQVLMIRPTAAEWE